MMQMSNGNTVDITLEEDEGGQELVVFSLDRRSLMRLTPYQARVLATELIMAVNRAEVRGNLKRSHRQTRLPEPAVSGGLLRQLFTR
jgi:hypothetical protein